VKPAICIKIIETTLTFRSKQAIFTLTFRNEFTIFTLTFYQIWGFMTKNGYFGDSRYIEILPLYAISNFVVSCSK